MEINLGTERLESWRPADRLPETWRDLEAEGAVYVEVRRGDEVRYLVDRHPTYGRPVAGARAVLDLSGSDDWTITHVITSAAHVESCPDGLRHFRSEDPAAGGGR
jgi:hypothetical protein